jgi:type I restriction enzyme R subunit
MSRLGNEADSVQSPIVKYATEIGWTLLDTRAAISERRGEGGLLLYRTLSTKLVELNPGLVTTENVDELIQRIDGVRSSIEGNHEILEWLRGKRGMYVEQERRQRHVTVIDFDHPSHNTFHVTTEWHYTNGQFANRADVVFCINGIPIAIVETKAATKPDAIEQGVKQISRYHRETPELVTAAQVFDVTHVRDFFYGATWNLERKAVFNWKEEEEGNFERKVKRFFSRERILKTLREWIVFFKRDEELKKIVLRQHQTRAVEKVIERCLDPEKRRGLIWHTQGSGKTFTMLKTAEMLLENEALKGEKPTILMLVDRAELEENLFRDLESYGLPYFRAATKRNLCDLLANDTRGLIISMIHKFEKADALLNTRGNVFILVDEAHRTTGGDLGNYLVAALPNATMIGFTGTPIDRTAHGKGTFKVFGADDAPKGYLDKYSISESIADKTTLPLRYTLAPNEIRVDRELLEKEFLSLKEAEGVSDIEELNRILQKAVRLKAFLKSEDHIAKVAAYVAKHFTEVVEPLGYKAFVVAIDREACALYKEALDRHLPPDYSRVVYSSQQNDEEQLSKYRIDEDDEKRIRKDFRKAAKQPKILIVTEKLLTGYDAPVLYCMYLDKPMRDHVLLQAIARVNRPYEDEKGIAKPSGFILDFIGIFENIEKALKFDSDELEDLQRVLQSIDVLKEQFANVMETEATGYLALTTGAASDKLIERAIDAFADREAREAFYKVFRHLEELYEIISPDAFLHPYIERYAALSTLYRLIRDAYNGRSASLSGDIMKKTEQLVRKLAESTEIRDTLPLIRLDEETLAALKADASASPAKVINLVRSIQTIVEAEKAEQPFLISIGDRATAVMELLDDRRATTAEALQQLEKLLAEYLSAKHEYEESGQEPAGFAIYQVLKLEEIEPSMAKQLGVELLALIRAFPHFRTNPAQARELRMKLYKPLRETVGAKHMKDVAEAILKAI